MAWGRVPLVGNVRLHVLSERMVRDVDARMEKLVVKWKACGKRGNQEEAARRGGTALYRGMGLGARDPVDRLRHFVARAHRGTAHVSSTPAEDFTGIFVFEFDQQGRVAKHTIEHADEGGTLRSHGARRRRHGLVARTLQWVGHAKRTGARIGVV